MGWIAPFLGPCRNGIDRSRSGTIHLTFPQYPWQSSQAWCPYTRSLLSEGTQSSQESESLATTRSWARTFRHTWSTDPADSGLATRAPWNSSHPPSHWYKPPGTLGSDRDHGWSYSRSLSNWTIGCSLMNRSPLLSLLVWATWRRFLWCRWPGCRCILSRRCPCRCGGKAGISSCRLCCPWWGSSSWFSRCLGTCPWRPSASGVGLISLALRVFDGVIV